MSPNSRNERSSFGSRRRFLRSLAGGTLLLSFRPTPAHSAAGLGTYRDLLDRALTSMEQGDHAAALSPLKEALLQDRTEACGLLALGTLYLHTGSATRAHQEFRRVHLSFPKDELARWGLCLSTFGKIPFVGNETASGKASPDDEPEIPESEIPEPLSLLFQEYRILMSGKPEPVRNATSYVTTGEKDLLRLEIAGFAALRSGDTERGLSLLRTLTEHPSMRPLAEDRALLFSFLPEAPTQPGAPTLPSAIGLPEPKTTATISGAVRLTPPQPLPDGVAFVAYDVRGGGGYTASTNYSPFTAEWNSTRFPNGLYLIRAVAYDTNGRELRTAERAVTVANRAAPLSRSLTSDARREFRERLLRLLTPRPTRKAAHYALAQAAARRGDEATALRHIESVVAIDPLYQNARASLREYNREVIGKCAPIWRAVTREKLVALTFDDGPHPVHTPTLLDALRAANAVATFFVVGIRAEAVPEMLRRMANDGHELANHSYSHPNLTFLPRTGIERELCRTSCIVREAIGKRPRFYRPPGGNVNRMVSDVAETLGMAGAYWTLDGLRYERPPFSAKHLTKYLLDHVRPGAILLLHNAPANTIAAIPEIVRGLRAKGYTPVTMSELARRARPAPPDENFRPSTMRE
ncbi:MAG: polysaccharide deacetylase family protein [Capsulimonadales bacterium]|nr:polysaccharide deacetylase family protein [Capsulimonadales bacterium]